MPSKVLIQVANDFHRRKVFSLHGILGGDALSVDTRAALRHVRRLRDRFTSGVLATVKALGDHNLTGRARFIGPNVLRVDDRLTVRARAVIIATGSRPIVPRGWGPILSNVLTTDELFELEDVPKSLAVIGLGVIGLELGQALHRLGVSVTGFGRSQRIGGLSDPEVIAYAVKKFGEELPLHLGHAAEVEAVKGGVRVKAGGREAIVDKVLASLGRRPNLDGLDLEACGVSVKPDGFPELNPNTMQVENLPLYIAGDADGYRPILHEAADEGRIAGFNAVRARPTSYRRRTRLGITFSDPNLCYAGERFEYLPADYAVGEVRFDGQGRSLVMAKNSGLLRVYGDPRTGRILGAEMIAPSGEHLAHLLAWAIQKEMTVFEALRMPFYHPVVEEGLRTALRDLAAKTDGGQAIELPLYDPSGIETLS